MIKTAYPNTLQLSWASAPKLLCASIICTFASALLQLALMLEVSQSVSRLSQPETLNLIAFAPLIALLLGVPVVSAVNDLLIYRLQYAVQLVLQPAALCNDFNNGRSSLSEQTRTWVGQEGISLQFYVIQKRLSGLASFLVLAQWNFILAALVTAAAWYSGHRTFAFAVKQQQQLSSVADESSIRSQFYWRALTSPEFAEETRLFGLNKLLTRRFENYSRKRLETARSDTKRGIVQSAIANLPLVGAMCLFFVWALRANNLDYPGFLSAAVVALPGLSGVGNQGSIQIRAHEFDEMVSQAVKQPKELTTNFSAAPHIPNDRLIEFRNVGFDYKNKSVFKGLTLAIRSGEKVAIVGPNGAGKSTLARLITGQEEAQQGLITLDGLPPGVKLDGTGLGYVAQDFMKYPGDPNEGIELGRDLSPANVQSLSDQLGISQILNAIKSPGAYSEGQWQKLAIARALLTESAQWGRLILLDEPTSALDIHAEQALYDLVIRNAEPNDTVIVITHRLQSVVEVDRIIVIDNGKIVQQGNHKELMADTKGLYAQMFTTQQRLYTVGSNSSEKTSYTGDSRRGGTR